METKRIYRRRGTPDLPLAMYVGIAGENMSNDPDISYHPEAEIMLQIAGSTVMEIDGNSITFHAGEIMLLCPNVPHRRIRFSDDARQHRIVFSTEAIRMSPGNFFQKEFVLPLSEGRLEMPVILQPGHPAYEEVYTLLLQVERCRIYEKNYRQRRLHLVMGICLALMPYCRIISYDQPIPDPGHEAVKLCMRYIHNHFAEKVTLEEMAKFCHLHPNYLCAIFKQHTGQTVFVYLNRIRVENATELLQKEDLPMAKVAELSGFHTECQFYKKFKAVMGTTPNAYRKATANKN